MASMKAAMPDLILHDGWDLGFGEHQGLNRRGRREGPQSARKGPVVPADLCRRSGRALAVRESRGAFPHSLRAALADQKQTDSFEQIGGGIHSPGEEYIGLRFVIVDADLA